MLFNSYIFILLFLPISLLLYFLSNKLELHKGALLSLTTMSFIFYAYNNISYLFVLIVSILVNWLFVKIMNRLSDARIVKLALLVGIFFNVGMIFYFKYYDFFIENMNAITGSDFILRNIVLPLGISFFTFQQISYLVDTYRKETQGYSFLEYVAFVSFFPQLVAGPIVLHQEIIPQFQDKSRWHFSHESFAEGLYKFAVGLFKKVLIADTFGIAVAWGWNNLELVSSLDMFLIMLAYTFQIYFDFSGYSDMAVGIAKMFHIDIPVNFHSPYKARSIIDFWSRWHITLTRFLRTYVYFPLGGSKKGIVRTYVNVFIVFLLSGIWHGANWTFIIWGIVHGIANILNRLYKKLWDKCPIVFQWICTFGFINLTWIIFRADNLSQALTVYKKIFSFDTFIISPKLAECFRLSEFRKIEEYLEPLSYAVKKIDGLYMWIFMGLALIWCICFANVHEKTFKPTIIKSVITTVLLVWSIVSFAGISTFLYFNF